MLKIIIRLLTLGALSISTMVQAGTLDVVKDRGLVKCSSTLGTPGFSMPDAAGIYQGLEPDFCRAIATAVFGDPEKVQIVPLMAVARFTGLQSGEVDVLFNSATWTLGREATNSILFAAVSYYDGQGIMVRSNEISTAKELDGAAICTNQGSTTEQNLTDFARTNNLKIEIVALATQEDASQAYESGRCDAFSSDRSGLYAFRSKMSDPANHVVLEEVISKEPLGVSVRQGDDQWYNIVKWSAYSLHAAEEYGLTSENIDEISSATTDPNLLRFVGKEGNLGESLGLTNDWALNIIRKVGNYGEIFDRNVGKDSPLKIDRGINASWKHGGLHYAPPMR